MCQSDIVVGTNFNTKDFESLSGDDKAFSDVHDMFFIHELFKDSEKFARNVLDPYKDAAEEENESKESNEFLDSFVNEDLAEGNESESDGEEVLTMSRVRFNSECILPSHLDSCSLNSLGQN